jgi:hypothetical protein
MKLPPVHRVSQTLSVVRAEGPRALAQRLVRRAYQGIGAVDLEFPLLPEDIADSGALRLPNAAGVSGTDPLTIGWLTTPPSAGSGGHTTMFRMVEALEQAGHTCELLIYDRYGSPAESHEAVIRANWPGVRAAVRDARKGVDGPDVHIATSWGTAHVLARRVRLPSTRAYFIQDYEPYFYPRGSLYALAEDSYRFGFTCLALGNMVAECLKREAGVASVLVPFGCDTSVYSLTNCGERSGVVFYTKPDVSRRGYLLAMLGLAEFHQKHPDQPIHVYGEHPRGLPFPVVRHDRMTPADLNALYNRSIAGLAMSFTNISLVAEEMLAAGAIPIVNDSDLARADLDHPLVGWAPPTPSGIAGALGSAVDGYSTSVSPRAAAGVHNGWAASQQALVSAVEAAAYGH